MGAGWEGQQDGVWRKWNSQGHPCLLRRPWNLFEWQEGLGPANRPPPLPTPGLHGHRTGAREATQTSVLSWVWGPAGQAGRRTQPSPGSPGSVGRGQPEGRGRPAWSEPTGQDGPQTSLLPGHLSRSCHPGTCSRRALPPDEAPCRLWRPAPARPPHPHPRSVNTLPEPPRGAPFPAWVCDPALIGDMGLCTSVLTFPQRHKPAPRAPASSLQPRLCSLAASEKGASRASREGRPSRPKWQQGL